MAMAQQQQDVYYYCDEQSRGCVDLYTKALKIVNGDNPDCWEYTACKARPGVNQIVHHAKLLGDTSLEVKGEHLPLQNLSPNTQYHVYFDVKLMHNAKGLRDPVMFEFTDQNGSIRRRPVKLMPGDARVLVGQFISTPSCRNVMAKLYDSGCQEKSGLLLRCISIVPADN